MTEKEKYEYVSGKFLTCIHSFGTFKQGHKYWLEYTGHDVYVGRSDNVLNIRFFIDENSLLKNFTV